MTAPSPLTHADAPLARALRRHAEAHLRYADRPPGTARSLQHLASTRPLPGWVDRVSAWLERLAVPYLRFGSVRHSSYNVMGYAGIVLGTLAATAVGLARGLPAGMLAVVWLAVVFVSLGQIIVTAWLTGRDRLVFLRFLIGGTIAAAVVLAALDRPFLPYLDVLLVGFGVLQATGRMGCHMAGCCHGRPAGWGVAYDARHRASALPTPLHGIRFVPAQLIESLWIAGCTAVAAAMILADAAPGAAAGAYLGLYTAGRFAVETLRGDLYRVHGGSLSEAQWVVLGIALLVAAFAAAGWLPVPTGVLPFLALPPALSLYRLVRRKAGDNTQPRAPEDALAIARALQSLRQGRALAAGSHKAVHVARAGAGLLLSGARETYDGGFIEHFTLSSVNGTLTDRDAHRLARTLSHLIGRKNTAILYKADDNLYHTLCYHDVAPERSTASPQQPSNEEASNES